MRRCALKSFCLVLICLISGSCGSGVQELSMTGICDGYPNPTTSPYKAPWEVNSTRTIAQGNCGPASHFGSERYAYDIEMPIGTNVLAARAGTVSAVVQDKTDGNGCAAGENHIFITHADGTSAHYLHLTKDGSLVAVGASVTQGQTIAHSGNTGCTSGPHLHFEVDSDANSGLSIPVTFSNVGSNRRGLILNHDYTPQ